MYLKNRLKFSKWLIPSLAVPIPALVAIACGNLDTTVNQAMPPIDTASLANVNQSATAYLTSITRLSPSADSTSGAITWPPVPPLPTALSEYYDAVQFSAQTADATPGPWTASLPTSLPAPFDARALTARLAPKRLLLSVLKPAEQTFPRAVLSQIKVDVAQLSTYRAPDFAALKLAGTATTLHFEATSLSAEVSPFIKWQFALGDQAFTDEAPFLAYLSANTQTVTQGEIAVMRAQLVPVNPADLRVIFTPVRGLVDTEPVKTLFAPTAMDAATITRAATEYLDALLLTRPLATSTHARLAWPSMPTFPSLLASYYAVPEFASSAASATTAVWSSQLPTAIASDFTARPLAVRLVAKPNTLGLTTLARDYPSSALSTVKTDVTQIPTYRAPDFSSVKLVGTALASLSLEGISLSEEVAKFVSWKFTLKSATAMSSAAFITYLQANASTITDVDLATTVAELSVIDPSEARVVFSPISGLVNTTTVSDFFAKGAPDKASVTLAATRYLDEVVATKYDPLSTHANILWNTFSPLPDALTPYYEAVEFSADAALGTAATWKQFLPASLTSDFAARRLEARLRPKTNDLALEELSRAFARTALEAIKVDVAMLATYTAPDFSKLIIRGVLASPFLEGFTLAPELATYIGWKFTIAGSPPLTASELVEYLKANANSITAATIDSVRAELALHDKNNPRAVFASVSGTPNMSAIAGFARPAPQPTLALLISALEKLRVQPGTVHSAATWTELPVPAPELAATYEAPEYFYGEAPYYGFEERYFIDYHNSFPAKRTFQPPTQLNSTLMEQTLYVLIKVKPTAPAYLVSRAIDITISSGIREVRIDLTALPSFTKLASAGVNVSVALNDPANLSVNLGENFATSADYADLRASADVEFQLGSGPWLSADAMRAQIINDYLAIDADALRGMRWRLRAKNLATHAVYDVTPRPVTITSAFYAPAHSVAISDAITAELNRLKAALNINIRFVTTKPSYYDNALYQRHNYTPPGGTEPTRLSLNAAPFTSYLRDPGANGETPFLTIYWRTEVNGAWHNANDTSARANYLLPMAFAALSQSRVMQIRFDYAGNSQGLVSEIIDLTASSNVRNLLLSFGNSHTTSIDTLKDALRTFHVRPGSTADNLEWPAFPTIDGDLWTKTSYSQPEYSTYPFTSEQDALTSPAKFWSLISPPVTVNANPAWRYVWVRVRTTEAKGIPTTTEVPFALDISDSTGVRQLPAT